MERKSERERNRNGHRKREGQSGVRSRRAEGRGCYSTQWCPWKGLEAAGVGEPLTVALVGRRSDRSKKKKGCQRN